MYTLQAMPNLVAAKHRALPHWPPPVSVVSRPMPACLLKNAAGTAALTGNQKVEIRLYNSPTGGTPLWGRTYSVLLDANGLFNIEASDGSLCTLKVFLFQTTYNAVSFFFNQI